MAKIAVRHAFRHAPRLLTRGASSARLPHRRVHHDRHCKRRRRRFTAVMRHFLLRWTRLHPCRRRSAAQRRRTSSRLPRAPSPLSVRVPVRTPAAALVTRSGCPQVLPPLLARTIPGTVNLAVIAGAANAHRYPTAPALVLPVSLLTHRNALPLEHWTKFCGRCIKDSWRCLTHAPHRGPGEDRKIVPRAFASSASASKNSEDWTHRGRQPKRPSMRHCVDHAPPVTVSIPLRQRRRSKPVTRVDYFWQAGQD
jgi:hypothetical protein